MGSNRHHTCSCDSRMISVAISIFFGIAAGFAFSKNLLPFVFVGIGIALTIAVIALILFWHVITAKKMYSDNDCICENFGLLLTGIIGTIVTSVIALSVRLLPFITVFAILVGLVAFFFALTIIGIISYLACVSDCDDDCDCDCDR